MMIAGASVCLVGCDSRFGETTRPQTPLQNLSDTVSTQPSTQVSSVNIAYELQYDSNQGWLQQSKENPAVYELISRHRGKLYEVAVVVTGVDMPSRFRSTSVTDPGDTVFFHLLPGASIPAHSGYHVLKLFFDAHNSGYHFRKNEVYDIAFTESGSVVALWLASLKVVPGWWYPEWWGSPNDEPWNDHRPKQPPEFELVPTQSQ
jgi:hypothetical protein